LPKLALFCVKNANIFAKFFGENILKIITSAQSGHPAALPFSLDLSIQFATEWLQLHCAAFRNTQPS
jgi:hypothetical protein